MENNLPRTRGKFQPDLSDFRGSPVSNGVDATPDLKIRDLYRFEDSFGKQFWIRGRDIPKTEKWGLFPVDQKAYHQKYKPTRRKTTP